MIQKWRNKYISFRSQSCWNNTVCIDCLMRHARASRMKNSIHFMKFGATAFIATSIVHTRPGYIKIALCKMPELKLSIVRKQHCDSLMRQNHVAVCERDT